MFKHIFLCLFIFTLIFCACKKNTPDSRSSSDLSADLSIDEAKSLYFRQSGIVTDPKENLFLGSPDWDKTMFVKISDRESALKVALKNPNLSHTTFRDLVFTKDKSGSVRCQVFEVLAHPGYLVQKQKEKGAGLNIRNYIEDVDFSGLLILRNLNGSIVKGRKYEDGQLKSELEFVQNRGNLEGGQKLNAYNRTEPSSQTNTPFSSKASTELASSTEPKPKSCTKDSDCDGSSICVKGVCIWIMKINTVEVIGHGSDPTLPPPTVFDWTIPITIAPAPGIGTAPSPSGTGTSGGSTGPGLLIAWPGPGEPNGLIVEDSTKSPCIKEVIKMALAEGLTNEITKIFNDLFVKNDPAGNPPHFDIFFFEGNLGAKVLGDTRSSNAYTIEITFNTQKLATASKEYIAATLFHETLHAMYDAKGISNGYPILSYSEYVQHNRMADEYAAEEFDINHKKGTRCNTGPTP